MNVCILNAGAWGTALAVLLARQNHTVTLVPRQLENALAMADTRENSAHLPGVELPASLQLGFEVKPAIMEAELLCFAAPTRFLAPWTEQVRAARPEAWGLRMVITLCKGLMPDNHARPSEHLAAVFPDVARGTLTGPSFAQDVAQQRPTAAVLAVAHADDELAARVQEALAAPSFRVYRSEDLAGAEYGGCLKNVYAIGAGICDGLRLGASAKASFVTRALAEMVRLGGALGGDPTTFYGLSGAGDLIATCHGPLSRNRAFGERLVGGATVDDLIRGEGMTVEGYHTCPSFLALCREHGIEAPILHGLHEVLYAGAAPLAVIDALMRRTLKVEDTLPSAAKKR